MHWVVPNRSPGPVPLIRLLQLQMKDPSSQCFTILTTSQTAGFSGQTGIFLKTTVQLALPFGIGLWWLSRKIRTYKDWNLREILIHSNLHSRANSAPGTVPCSTDRCKALTPPLEVPIVTCLSRRLTCQSDNLVYAIACQSCNLIYVGDTSRSLVVCFSEHLADICHNRSKSVAQHFNSAGHTNADVKVKGLWQLHGDSFQQKHMESHIIQRLGTMSPGGLNENCSNFL